MPIGTFWKQSNWLENRTTSIIALQLKKYIYIIRKLIILIFHKVESVQVGMDRIIFDRDGYSVSRQISNSVSGIRFISKAGYLANLIFGLSPVWSLAKIRIQLENWCCSWLAYMIHTLILNIIRIWIKLWLWQGSGLAFK